MQTKVFDLVVDSHKGSGNVLNPGNERLWR